MHRLKHISRIKERYYFFTFKFLPAIIMKLVIERLKILCGCKIDEAITNITLILKIKGNLYLKIARQIQKIIGVRMLEINFSG